MSESKMSPMGHKRLIDKGYELVIDQWGKEHWTKGGRSELQNLQVAICFVSRYLELVQAGFGAYESIHSAQRAADLMSPDEADYEEALMEQGYESLWDYHDKQQLPSGLMIPPDFFDGYDEQPDGKRALEQLNAIHRDADKLGRRNSTH